MVAREARGRLTGLFPLPLETFNCSLQLALKALVIKMGAIASVSTSVFVRLRIVKGNVGQRQHAGLFLRRQRGNRVRGAALSRHQTDRVASLWAPGLFALHGETTCKANCSETLCHIPNTL